MGEKVYCGEYPKACPHQSGEGNELCILDDSCGHQRFEDDDSGTPDFKAISDAYDIVKNGNADEVKREGFIVEIKDGRIQIVFNPAVVAKCSACGRKRAFPTIAKWRIVYKRCNDIVGHSVTCDGRFERIG